MVSGAGYGIGDGAAVDYYAGAVQSGLEDADGVVGAGGSRRVPAPWVRGGVPAACGRIFLTAGGDTRLNSRGGDAPTPLGLPCFVETRISTPCPMLRYPSEEIQKHGSKLPHWQQNGVMQFVTFRLGDSLPSSKLAAWQESRKIFLEQNPKRWTDETEFVFRRRFTQRIEEWLDEGSGSCIFGKPSFQAAEFCPGFSGLGWTRLGSAAAWKDGSPHPHPRSCALRQLCALYQEKSPLPPARCIHVMGKRTGEDREIA